MNKDFYDRLPSFVCEILEDLIKLFEKEKWFNNAWEEYRQHILNTNMENMKMPGYVFNKYKGAKK